MNTRTYKVTQEEMEEFKSAALHDKSTKVEGGDLDGVLTHGSGLTKVVLNWKYDPASGTLLVGIAHRPPFVGTENIFNHIEEISGLQRS